MKVYDMCVELTEDKVRDDFRKLKELHAEFNKMSDEDIAPINSEFYGKLEMVSKIAKENGLNTIEAIAYYKLSMWLKMIKHS